MGDADRLCLEVSCRRHADFGSLYCSEHALRSAVSGGLLRPIFPIHTVKRHGSGRREGRRVVDLAPTKPDGTLAQPLTPREQRSLDEAHAVGLACRMRGGSTLEAQRLGLRQLTRRTKLRWALAWRLAGWFVCSLRGHKHMMIRADSTIEKFERHFVCLRCFETQRG